MMGTTPPPVLVITGPTASGKSALAYALADRLEGEAEFINADSFQVYRGLDIGTAKPDHAERQKISHHLIDFLDPDEACDLGRYMAMANAAIAEVLSRGKLPIVCGGTVYYIKHLVQGMPEAPPSDPGIRQELEARLAREGAGSLYQELSRADPVSAKRIHVNDVYRICRALEVFLVSGKPLSSFRREAGTSGYDFRLVNIAWPREVLWRRMERRCEGMRDKGLRDEVMELFRKGYHPGHPGMKAIGYREFFRERPDGWSFREDTDAVFDEIYLHTRQYAKRQETFIRSLETCMPIRGDDDQLEQTLTLVTSLPGAAMAG